MLASGAAAGDAGSDKAREAYQQGRYGEALTHWEAALPGLSDQPRIDVLLHMAAAYQALGRAGAATASLNEAYTLAKGSGNTAHQALVLGLLSDSYLVSRQLEEAENTAGQALFLARRSGNPVVIATALNHQGNALMAQARYPDALAAYGAGVTLAERAADPALLVTLQINAIHGHLAQETTQEALPLLKTALAKTRTLPDSHNKATDLIALGYLAQRLAESGAVPSVRLGKQAYNAFTDALAIAEASADTRTQSYALGHLGEFYLSAGRLPEAEKLLHRALFFAEQSDAPEIVAQWHRQLGLVHLAQGKLEPAKASYLRALNELRPIQSALIFGQRGRPASFRESTGAIYLELAELLLQEAGTATDDTERVRLLRGARDVIEDFKTIELKDYFRDECVTAWQETQRPTAVGDLLQPGAAVLYPIVLPEHTVLLLSLAGGALKQFNVPVSAAELRETAVAFRRQLTRSGNPRRLRVHGLTLYEWLLKPVVSELEAQAVHTLVIVPDDVLRTIPFAALYDGHGFLVERYALAVTPGLSLTAPKVSAQTVPQLLLGGLSEGVQAYTALPHVAKEIDKIGALYDSTQLLNSAFRKREVQDQLERNAYWAILFATHGQFSTLR